VGYENIIEVKICKAGDDLFCLGLNIVFHLLLTLVLDTLGDTPALRRRLVARAAPVGLVEEDEDVKAEKARVAAMTLFEKQKQKICVDNVRKVYRPSVHAVKGISFAANQGQVFGLLGINGAGKTTTFRMLCAQYTPSAGGLWVAGHDVTRKVSKVRQSIGYCPQFDAILDLMTVREHLDLFAKVKGLHGEVLQRAVERRLKEMDLLHYADSRAGQLSGGNKRKLSVAMATMGEPPIIFLDEPSAGMDPHARRYMWDVIQNIASQRDSSVVIITTHSMEEAEALCSRVAIQVDGQFRCLGSCQQIKARYGGGYEVNIKFGPSDSAGTKAGELLKGWFPEAASPGSVRVSFEDALKLCGADSVHGLARSAAAQAPNGILTDLQGKSIEAAELAAWWIVETQHCVLLQFLRDKFGEITIVDKHGASGRYLLKGAEVRTGRIFGLLEENKDELMLEDYQVSQTTLEQIFNGFASTAQHRSNE